MYTARQNRLRYTWAPKWAYSLSPVSHVIRGGRERKFASIHRKIRTSQSTFPHDIRHYIGSAIRGNRLIPGKKPPDRGLKISRRSKIATFSRPVDAHTLTVSIIMRNSGKKSMFFSFWSVTIFVMLKTTLRHPEMPLCSDSIPFYPP